MIVRLNRAQVVEAHMYVVHTVVEAHMYVVRTVVEAHMYVVRTTLSMSHLKRFS